MLSLEQPSDEEGTRRGSCVTPLGAILRPRSPSPAPGTGMPPLRLVDATCRPWAPGGRGPEGEHPRMLLRLLSRRPVWSVALPSAAPVGLPLPRALAKPALRDSSEAGAEGFGEEQLQTEARNPGKTLYRPKLGITAWICPHTGLRY